MPSHKNYAENRICNRKGGKLLPDLSTGIKERNPLRLIEQDDSDNCMNDQPHF